MAGCKGCGPSASSNHHQLCSGSIEGWGWLRWGLSIRGGGAGSGYIVQSLSQGGDDPMVVEDSCGVSFSLISGRSSKYSFGGFSEAAKSAQDVSTSELFLYTKASA